MNSALIGSLLLGVLYLGFRWIGSRAEIAQLRNQITTLKRQLARRAQ